MSTTARQDLNDLLRDRFASDPDFADALRADPRGVLSRLVGRDVPPHITIDIHEESLSHIHLVIPTQATPEGEIADEDLALVAGGDDGYPSNPCDGDTGVIPGAYYPHWP